MASLKVVVTRSLPTHVLAETTKRLGGKVQFVTWTDESPAPRSFLLSQIKGAVGLICMLNDKIDEELVSAAGPSLKVISSVSAGYDHVNSVSLTSRKIKLGTTPDALTDATADIGAMLTLMASRRVGEGMRAVLDGQWSTKPWAPLLYCGGSIQNSTVGILGFGRIGQLTLARLIGFGIKEAIYSTSVPGAPLSPSKDYFDLIKHAKIPISAAKNLDDLAARSDFLIICSALTPATKDLVNAAFFSKMKPTSYVINTARGGIVNSKDLNDALNHGVIAGAGLDVLDGEPNIPADHPLVLNKKAIVLPHLGSATVETRSIMCFQAVQNVLAGLEIEVDGERVGWVNQVNL